MVKELRKRFILFNMMVIACVLVVLAGFVFWGSRNDPSIGRFIPTIVISLILVFSASLTISKFALQPVKQAWQKQLDFTADASHELRTPLAVIKTNLEIVMDSPEQTVESQMKWLRNIEVEHTRMTKLVEDLLTLSRADTEEQSLFPSIFLLDETAQKVIDTIQPLCGQKSITLIQNIESDISFEGDEKRITQLMVILLDNAVQYTKANGNITLALRKTEKEILLTVQDTGAGIAKEDTGKIFERFYRVDQTRQQNPDGSGLGLSIAKWIAEQHHGSISLKSSLGKGTIFSVRLPL